MEIVFIEPNSFLYKYLYEKYFLSDPYYLWD